MAIAQTVQALKGGQKWTAVLDLESAYDTVRRDLLFERRAKVLPDHITAMISHTLQTLTVTTLGDDTKTEAKIDKGVTQGGSASPTLFNIFIGTLPNALQRHLWNPNSGLPAHLYTDDVIIHVKSMLDLQRALIICERWAEQCGMRWARSKGKSEVLLPPELALQYKAFPFAGGQITTVTQARYLGVVLSANGILECSLKHRIQMSHASLTTLRNAKLIFPGVDPTYAKMVYRTLIESKMDYATFLCPSSAEALHAFDCLLQRFFQCCLGIRVRQSQIPRLLLMFNIDSLGIRRRTLANAFAGRLMSTLDDDNATARQKLQAKKTQIALNFSEAFQRIVPLVTKPLRKDQTMLMRQNIREVISRSMRRPVPMPTTPSGTTAEGYEAQSSTLPMASRSVSCSLSLPLQYWPTHIPGRPEVPKPEERVKPGTEKDTNRAYSTFKHPRILLPQCTTAISFMKTGRLPS